MGNASLYGNRALIRIGGRSQGFTRMGVCFFILDSLATIPPKKNGIEIPHPTEGIPSAKNLQGPRRIVPPVIV
jgi:hypothetical protein